MGMRYPTFTTGIGLVHYEAHLDEINQIVKGHSVTKNQQIEAGSVHDSHLPDLDYNKNQVEAADEPKKKIKRKEDTFSYKAKSFFSNFFD